jgi:hypothetical protein
MTRKTAAELGTAAFEIDTNTLGSSLRSSSVASSQQQQEKSFSTEYLQGFTPPILKAWRNKNNQAATTAGTGRE